MSIDIIDFSSSQPSLIKCHLHRPSCPLPIFVWLRDVVGVGTGSIGSNFSQDVSPPLLGMGEVFQDKDAGSIANNKAIAFSIYGARG